MKRFGPTVVLAAAAAWSATIWPAAAEAPIDTAAVKTSTALAPVQALPSDWKVIVSPYLWGASLNGNASVYHRNGTVDVPFSKVLENLDFGVMGSVEVTDGHVGVFVNGEYVNVSGSQAVRGIDLSYGSTTAIVAMGAYVTLFSADLGGLTYEGGPRRFSIQPLVGMRWTRLSVKAGVGPFALSGREEWVDPIVGVRTSLDLSERWNLALEGDVGGFQQGADLALNGQAYIGYRTTLFGQHTLLRAGYRALYQDYENGGFRWDVTQHGPVLGASISF